MRRTVGGRTVRCRMIRTGWDCGRWGVRDHMDKWMVCGIIPSIFVVNTETEMERTTMGAMSSMVILDVPQHTETMLVRRSPRLVDSSTRRFIWRIVRGCGTTTTRTDARGGHGIPFMLFCHLGVDTFVLVLLPVRFPRPPPHPHPFPPPLPTPTSAPIPSHSTFTPKPTNSQSKPLSPSLPPIPPNVV